MKNKSYKHWIIVMVCCGLSASSIGLSINSSGVFYTPVSESLNILRGSFAFHMTVFSLVSALCALFIPRLMQKISYQWLLIAGVSIAVLSTGFMAFSKNLLLFYILGALRGLGTSLFSIVPLTIIINHWFEEKHGLATSIVFSFSGVAGSLFSPILSLCITQWGWQVGYLIKALLILILCLPALVYPFHIDPKMDGLLPYGYKSHRSQNASHINTKFHYVSIAFICFFIFSMLCSCITGITQHLSGYGESLHMSVQISALLISSAMIGNIISKLLVGILSDWLGSFKATIVMLLSLVLGIGLLIYGSSSWLLLCGAFLFGSCYGIGAVCLPLLTHSFFHSENYAQVFPKISFASNIGSAISLSMVGFIYDFFGSYVIAFFIALMMIGICLVCLILTYKCTLDEQI